MTSTEWRLHVRGLGLMAAIVGSTAVYALAIRWVYATLITDDFAYLGYSYVPGRAADTVMTIAMTTLVALLMPRTIERASQVVLWVIYGTCVVPSMTMVDFTGYVGHATALTVTATIGLSFSIVALGIRRRRPSAAIHTFPPILMWSTIVGFSLATYVLMTATMGLSLRPVSLDGVYDARDEFKSQLAGGGILAYLISAQANIFNPFILARGLMQRRWTLIAAGIVGQLLIYSASGLKSVLFSTPTVLIVALLIGNRKRVSPLAFAVGPVVLMIAAALADEASGSRTWTSLFSRRFLITPGLLTSVYTRFFTDNPKDHLGGSILRWWVQSPYDAPPANIVGQYIRSDSKLIANANIFADGFANFGWWGVVGAGIGLLIYLRVLDRCSAGLPLSLTSMTLIIPSITLSNSALLTAMLSHGLAAAPLLLWLAPRTDRAQPQITDLQRVPFASRNRRHLTAAGRTS